MVALGCKPAKARRLGLRARELAGAVLAGRMNAAQAEACIRAEALS